MMNLKQHEQPAARAPNASVPHSLPQEDDEAARDRWRRIGRRLGEVVEARVDALLLDQSTDKYDGAPDDPFVRKICALIIASQRSMEMHDSYDKKAGADAKSPSQHRRDEELAERVEQRIDREFEALRDGGRDGAPGGAR